MIVLGLLIPFIVNIVKLSVTGGWSSSADDAVIEDDDDDDDGGGGGAKVGGRCKWNFFGHLMIGLNTNY